MRQFVLGAAAVLAVQGLIGLGYIYSGFFAIAAREPHTHLLWWVTDTTKNHSVRRGAAQVESVPDLDDPGRIARGLRLYREHCLQCHGGPGVGPDPVGRGVYPPAPSLLASPDHWNSAELFWMVKNGIKMSAMPAWHVSDDEADIWAVVAFVEHMPDLTPAEFQDLLRR